MADEIPLVAAVQLKQTSHEVAAALTGYGDLRSSEPTTATLCQSFSSVVEMLKFGLGPPSRTVNWAYQGIWIVSIIFSATPVE
jgi:hypothetical protein